MKVLLDFSQTVISAVAVNAEECKGSDAKDLIKHTILNLIYGLRQRFGGELIICCDCESKNYWRTKEFRWYKGHRKHSKNNDFLDWNLVYEVVNETKRELAESFPYRVMEVEGAEADDIIAILVKYFDENELVNTGLIQEPDNIVIVSTDLDFQQLQKYRNVQQWNNSEKKMIVCKNPKQFLIEHIAGGDAGDNVPNVCTADLWSQQRAEGIKTKAKSFMTARLKDFYNKGIDACKDEYERRSYLRNEKLVDLDMIPSAIYNDVVGRYQRCEIKGSTQKVFSYLTRHRMKLLLGYSQDF